MAELIRPHDGRLIGGVCLAIANRFDMSVVVIRVLMVLSVVFFGLSLWLYLLLWLLIPSERTDRSARPPGCRRQRPRWRDERRARAVRSCHAGLVPRRVRRPRPTRRSARGRPSRTAGTRSWSRRPGRARRCRRSSGRSTASSTRRTPRPARPPARGREAATDAAASPTRILYISPLKALGVDVERNLRSPLVGIGQSARRLGHRACPRSRVGVRSGDTTSSDRRKLVTAPPDILITTPESLYLMLTSQAGETLTRRAHRDRRRGARGRRDQARRAPRGEPRAARRPAAALDPDARPRSASGCRRPCARSTRSRGSSAARRRSRSSRRGRRRRSTCSVVVPVDDMLNPPPPPEHRMPSERADADRRCRWTRTGSPTRSPASAPSGARRDRDDRVGVAARRRGDRRPHPAAPIDDRVLQLAAPRRAADRRGSTRSTPSGSGSICPTPRSPRRLMAQAGATAGADPVLAKAHHGSVSKEQRAQVEEELKSGVLRCVVATSSLELGIDMGAVDLVIQVEAPPSAASGLQRIGRAGPPGRRGQPRGALPEAPRRRAAHRDRHRADAGRADRGDLRPAESARHPRAADRRRLRARPRRRRGLVRDAQAQRAVPLAAPLRLRGDARPARGPLPLRRVRRAAPAPGRGIAITARSPAAPAPSASPSRAAARSPTAACSASSSPASRRTPASASSTRRWSTSRA